MRCAINFVPIHLRWAYLSHIVEQAISNEVQFTFFFVFCFVLFDLCQLIELKAFSVSYQFSLNAGSFSIIYIWTTYITDTKYAHDESNPLTSMTYKCGVFICDDCIHNLCYIPVSGRTMRQFITSVILRVKTLFFTIFWSFFTIK